MESAIVLLVNMVQISLVSAAFWLVTRGRIACSICKLTQRTRQTGAVLIHFKFRPPDMALRRMSA